MAIAILILVFGVTLMICEQIITRRLKKRNVDQDLWVQAALLIVLYISIFLIFGALFFMKAYWSAD